VKAKTEQITFGGLNKQTGVTIVTNSRWHGGINQIKLVFKMLKIEVLVK
jgi:hypothetical protein